jgi:hypothetical protein
MAHKFIRVFKKIDIDQAKNHLLICGELSGSCSKCSCLGIKFDNPKCPQCGTDFKYVTFRSIRENMPKVQRLAELPYEVAVIDYDDYKTSLGAAKAHDFLK